MMENKLDKLSVQHRNEGNSQYSKKEYFNAIISYNKALCYAVSKENLAFAYANRSAMYFELKRYQKCLENIKWARESDYPAEKVQKLIEREEKCKKMLGIDAEFDAGSIYKLSYPANPKIPFIVECLEVRTTEEFGRGVYTTQDLKPGDIIALDKPVLHSVNPTCQFNRCCNCMNNQMQSLIPCLKTASLMFCTVECRDKAYTSYPDISCMLLASDEVFPLQVARLRALAENAFNGHENLMKYLKTNEYKKAKETIFDFDLSNPNDPSYEMNRMKAVFSLMSRAPAYYNDAVKNDCKEVAKGNKRLEEFLKHVCGIFVRNNCYLQLPEMKNQLTGPISSLFNHSCLANVADFYSGDTLFFFVFRPVKAGEQLFINYLKFPFLESLAERQKILQESHDFVCRCVYCVNNVHFDDIYCRASVALQVTFIRSYDSCGLHSRMSNKDMIVELLKQLKENDETIIKNGDNPYSPELYLLPDCNHIIHKLLSSLFNLPCIFMRRNVR